MRKSAFKSSILRDKESFERKNVYSENSSCSCAIKLRKPHLHLDDRLKNLYVGAQSNSTSSLTSDDSSPSKVELPCRRLDQNKSTALKTSKSKKSYSDLDLIGATTSPYRSEWEDKNRPFTTRFLPFKSINKTETEQICVIGDKVCSKSGINSTRYNEPKKWINIREAEKDRLAQIFAFSSPLSKVTLKETGIADELSNLSSTENNSEVITGNNDLASLIASKDLENVDNHNQGYKTTQIGNDNLFPIPEENKHLQWNVKSSTTLNPFCQNKKGQREDNDFSKPVLSLDHGISQGCIVEKENVSPKTFNSTKEVDCNEKYSDLFISHNIAEKPCENRRKMVRIGEYSPLNIKLRPSGHIVLGLGEYEERKKLLLEQRKKEYCQYKEQALLMANNCQKLKKQLHASEQKIENVKNVSTQTENLCQNECCIQQQQEVLTDLSIRSPSTMDSKMCLKKNELTPNQIKQFLYREELMKQISERQQIEAKKKLQDKLEEEAIEAKFKQQQMEIEKKYESDVEKKMQEALKKREQEEALHRHLIEMEKQTMQRKHQRCKNHVASPSRNNFEGSSKINKPRKDDHHEEFLKNPSINYPQLENNGIVEELNENEDLASEQIVGLDSRCDNPKETKTTCDNVLNNKRDVIRKKAYVKSPKSISPSRNNITSNSPSFTVLNYVDPISEMRQRHAEAEDILCMPLSEYSIDNSPASVPVQNDPLPPPSNIETKDFIQPTTRPKSPPIPAATTRARTISDKLHEKWLIPAVEKYVVTPIDIHSHNSRSVLTQLGAFRKHLQLEQMRMINNSSSGKKN